MEVILLERVAKLGQMGEVVTVKDGYARNYLLPQKKAMRANDANRAAFEAKKRNSKPATSRPAKKPSSLPPVLTVSSTSSSAPLRTQARSTAPSPRVTPPMPPLLRASPSIASKFNCCVRSRIWACMPSASCCTPK